ncbi:MAG: anion permease, partial [Planctomycetales bacterium]|nr:anion permease [Planctomycetales bacterium]
IGTPPNAFFAGFLAEHQMTISFGRWMLLAMPLVIVMLFATWLLLTRWVFPIRADELPGGRATIVAELAKLGRVSRGERIVLTVFVTTAIAWIVREPLTHWTWLVERFPTITSVDDSLIAMLAALVLFMIPVDARAGVFALDWPTANRLPWGILLLFGGGLSLAKAIESSRLAEWMGNQVAGLGSMPGWVVVLAVTLLIIFLTEITSNLATVTAFLPILFSVAEAAGIDPMLLLLPATLAASFAFMLPVATPPNAIVFGSGQVSIGHMVRAGLWLNLTGAILIPILVYTLGAWLLK